MHCLQSEAARRRAPVVLSLTCDFETYIIQCGLQIQHSATSEDP